MSHLAARGTDNQFRLHTLRPSVAEHVTLLTSCFLWSHVHALPDAVTDLVTLAAFFFVAVFRFVTNSIASLRYRVGTAGLLVVPLSTFRALDVLAFHFSVSDQMTSVTDG